MITSRLFRKTFLIVTVTVVIFILLGNVTSSFLLRFSESPRPPGSAAFFAHMIDGVSPGNRIEAFKKVESWRDERFPIHFELVDAQGHVLFPPGAKLDFDWQQAQLPTLPYESSEFHSHGPDLGPPGPHHGPPHEHWDIVRFGGESAQYLVVSFRPGKGGSPKPPFFILFGSLAISILLGIGVSLFFIFKSIQEKAVLADHVIAELQNGNLKARFPIGKMDEFGQAMRRFNLMADEIERLVEHLRSIEGSRVSLLQELAHDLRTPIASLRSLLETLQIGTEKIEPELHQEVLGLALKETEYFERLVEDLLVLAQVSEPKYQGDQHEVNLNELLEDEAESVSAKVRSQSQAVKLTLRLPSEPVRVNGDFQLLKRMFRNALDNAFSFARSEVVVSLDLNGSKKAHVVVQDDGPGLSTEALHSYGERRVSRVLGGTREGRVSVGLGSVIIKTVARIHGGTVVARNQQGSGAQITIELPAQA